MEIERKFLVKTMPERLEQYPCRRIEQVYLSTKPVIRARRMDDAYILTCKGKGLLTREEHELFLDVEEYGELLKRAEGTPIAKNRYLIPYGDHTIELDVFDPPFAPLVVAEVEFFSEEEAAAFTPPDWFGEDVTGDPAYTNAALSRRLQPAPEIKPGRYRHFKGNEYRVLSVARHSETQEPMVVYQALYGEQGVWVRPASMWNEEITRDGTTFRRFTLIEEEA
ncbi:MAG: DUF1653 domain-containing protein [Oscillibacter sp.]|nr:DUF1653 domain-containing protein [Oscillibacter sp.]